MSKIVSFLVLGFSLMISSSNAFSKETATLSEADTNKVLALRDAILVLEDNTTAQIITEAQAKQGISRYLLQAKEILGRDISEQEILAFQGIKTADVAVKLTPLQKFAGFITFMNVIWVIAIVGGVSCLTYLFGDFVMNVLKGIPKEVYEVLLYLVAIATLFCGKQLANPEIGNYVGFTGCLLWLGALGLTAELHKKTLKWSGALFWSLVFSAWVSMAILYQSQMIGWIAIAALLSALGFSIVVKPFVVSMGFDDEDSLGRATAASFLILSFYVVTRIFNLQIPHLEIFSRGALFLGSFVGFLGLDILSTRWYFSENKNYTLFQVITIFAGLAAISIGSIYSIGELQKFGGTFFVLYLLTKVSEIPAKSMRGWAAIGLVVSSILYGFCVYVKSNPEVFAPYLFMV